MENVRMDTSIVMGTVDHQNITEIAMGNVFTLISHVMVNVPMVQSCVVQPDVSIHPETNGQMQNTLGLAM